MTDLPAELSAMLAALADADPIYHPSRYWDELNRDHLARLASPEGYAHLKRTLNESYFQFGLYAFPRALPVLVARWLRHPDPAVLLARIERGPVRFQLLLGVAVALYANAVASGSGGALLDRIAEPAVGDPIMVRYGRRRVSQDLCHSVEEYAGIVGSLAPHRPMPRRVAEIGAGYGRLAYVFLRAAPDVRYHVVDIPPALYVSQRYLTEVLPDVPVFRFRPFRRYADVADEIAAARLVFLEPQQLELFPNDHFDLVATVSTLHEMRPEQIANFLRLADRVCAGAFYTKQWRRWFNPRDDVRITMDDYPIPRRWRRLFHRSPLVPREFFEELYLTR